MILAKYSYGNWPWMLVGMGVSLGTTAGEQYDKTEKNHKNRMRVRWITVCSTPQILQ